MTSAGEWSVPGYLQARKRKTEGGNAVACRETVPPHAGRMGVKHVPCSTKRLYNIYNIAAWLFVRYTSSKKKKKNPQCNQNTLSNQTANC